MGSPPRGGGLKSSPFSEGGMKNFILWIGPNPSICSVIWDGWKKIQEKETIGVGWEGFCQKRVTKRVFTKAKKKKQNQNPNPFLSCFLLFHWICLVLIFSALQWWVGVFLLSKALRAKRGSWPLQAWAAPKRSQGPQTTQILPWMDAARVCVCVFVRTRVCTCVCATHSSGAFAFLFFKTLAVFWCTEWN